MSKVNASVPITAVPSIAAAPTTDVQIVGAADVTARGMTVALNTPPVAVTIGVALSRPVGTGGSYRVARGSTERVHVVKPPTGADPTRDPEAARPRAPDTSGT